MAKQTKTPKQQADELFNEHYTEIMLIGTDLSQEVIVSILAIRHAKITAMHIAKNCVDSRYWHDVITEIEKL